MWNTAGGWASCTYREGERSWYFLLKQEHWSVFAHQETLRWAKCNLLFHEYFHVLQHQLQGHFANPPLWLVEGTAERMEALAGQATGCGSHRSRYSEELRKLSVHSPTLRSQESDQPGTWEYTLGFFASDLLAKRAGDASVVEFWRRFASTPIGPHLLWDSKPSWQEAFQAAFGISVDAFYDEFNEWRGERASEDYGAESQPDASGPVIKGIVVGPDGVGLPGIRVSTFVSDRQHETRSAQDGRFTLKVPVDGKYRVWIRLNVGCGGFYVAGNTDLGRFDDASMIDTRDEEGDLITVRIAADQCLS